MGNKRLRALTLPSVITLVLFFLCSIPLAMGLGGREKKREPQPAEEDVILKPAVPDAEVREPAARDTESRQVRVSGQVRLVGNDPFPQLVISGDEREWYIDREEELKLRDLQQQFVTVEGTESYTDLTFANGTPAGRRYTLKDLKVTGRGP